MIIRKMEASSFCANLPPTIPPIIDPTATAIEICQTTNPEIGRAHV